MFGRTPPPAMATEPRSLFSSSSLRTASWMWRGMMRVFLLSRAALPASSRTSAQRYSRTWEWWSVVSSTPSPARVEENKMPSHAVPNGAHVDARRGRDAARAHLAQVAREARARELEARLGRRRGRLAGGLALAAAALTCEAGRRSRAVRPADCQGFCVCVSAAAGASGPRRRPRNKNSAAAAPERPSRGSGSNQLVVWRGRRRCDGPLPDMIECVRVCKSTKVD